MLLITHSFPFGDAEKTFLAPEVEILKNYYDLTIISRNTKDNQTTNFSDEVNLYRYDPQKGYHPFGLFLNTLISKDYWQELGYLIKHHKYDLFCMKQALTIHMRMLHFKSYVRGICNSIKEPIVYYTYWNGYETYACQKLRKSKDRVITRTHGGDLYLKVDNHNYQPFKDITNKSIDRIYFISEDGKRYYEETFEKLKAPQLKVMKLGTINRNIQNKKSSGKSIKLVSLSRMYWVKRLDKLIEALSEIDDLEIEWTHIGDGELHNQIFEQAHQLLDGKENIKYFFEGNLQNEQVYEYFRNNEVDFIVNTSYSEGLPVSIIEAMSCGIPAIAVDVGGIPEIVINNKTGYLIKRDFTNEDFYVVLRKYVNLSEKQKYELRINAFNMWKNEYDANENHEKFADDIYGLLRGDE